MTEMVDETMEGLDEDAEDLEEEADEEIEKVLFEITNGKLGEATGKVGTIPVRSFWQTLPSLVLYSLCFQLEGFSIDVINL